MIDVAKLKARKIDEQEARGEGRYLLLKLGVQHPFVVDHLLV